MNTIQTAIPKDKAPQPSRGNAPVPAESKPPPALPVDLATLPDAILAALADEAPREIERRKAKREEEFFASFKQQAEILGITPARLAAAMGRKSAARPRANGGTDGRHVVKPKFSCPTDHSLRWAGRGVAPKWYADHIASGGKPEDMLIPEGAL